MEGILMGLGKDKHAQVAVEAIDQLQHFDSERARVALHNFCGDPDNGRALAAITALATKDLVSSDLPALMEAYQSAHGDVSMEVCFNALLAASKIEGQEASDFLQAGLLHEDPYVKQIAREKLIERGETPSEPDPEDWTPEPTPRLAPILRGDQANPKVAIETTRGTMVFELYPDVAPTHVHSFLDQAENGHYNGLTWHRVVSDFVIQGGCYRGDGNGGGTWRGPDDALNQEFSELSYVEGALGMPRNANPNSGGNQIFITHRPTPHLDARYTLFGTMLSGAEPLHRIEEGDRILNIRRLP